MSVIKSVKMITFFTPAILKLTVRAMKVNCYL